VSIPHFRGGIAKGEVMPEKRRKFDPELGDGAMRIVRETAKTIRQVGR
jgi:hypothetical protein